MSNLVWTVASMLLVPLAILFVFTAGYRWWALKQKTGDTALSVGGMPKVRKNVLLSDVEQVLFLRLVKALPDYVVFGQVQLSRIVSLENGPSWQAWFNKISRKSVDFVVCSKSFDVLCAIELDDKTHEQADRQKADADKYAVLKASGVRFIRWQVQAMPSVDEIRELLHLPPLR